MNTNKAICMSAVVLLAVGLMSCQGRRADGTPNGETVEVVVGPAVTATDTADNGTYDPQAGDAAETSGETLPQEDEPTSEAQHIDGNQGV